MTRRSVIHALRSFLTAPFRARTWKEGVYLVCSSLLSGASFLPAAVLLAPGAFLVILFIYLASKGGPALLFGGVFALGTLVAMAPLLAIVLMTARQVSADLHRGLAASLLGEWVPEPPPLGRPARRGFLGWLGWSLGDEVGWRAFAFLVLSAPITAAGFYAALLATTIGAVSATYPLWRHLFDPTNTDAEGVVHHSGMQFGDYYIETWPRALMVAAVGLLVVLAVPWIVRGVAWADRQLVRTLLGPGRTSARLRDLEETRAQVVDDSAATLRRIERDLHDGTQARLVALAMQLDMVREQLSDDASDRARELVDTAHRNATEAITELREVTRSIHPPALDRGLDDALATLAARSAVPTILHTQIRERPSPAIETIAYFCVAELLANVAKHSGASQATVGVTQDEGGRVHIRVGDDGGGGARITDGRGLAGLADRVRAVDGRLSVDSPSGGPTVVTVDLPRSS